MQPEERATHGAGQFSGKIAGLNVSASASAPANEINIQATSVASAALSGTTLTMFNGGTTVATLALAGSPVSGAYALVQADGGLGGYDVFLSDALPVVISAGASITGLTDQSTDVIAATVTDPDGVADVEVYDGATNLGAATLSDGV